MTTEVTSSDIGRLLYVLLLFVGSRSTHIGCLCYDPKCLMHSLKARTYVCFKSYSIASLCIALLAA